MPYGNIKTLASQTLHATESIVYRASASKSTEIGTIWLYNGTSTSQIVNIWFPFTATTPTGSFSASYSLLRFGEYIPGYSATEVSPKVPFIIDGSASEKITMKCSQSGSVNVIITGREEV